MLDDMAEDWDMNPTVICAQFGAGMLAVQRIERAVGVLAMVVHHAKIKDTDDPERVIAEIEKMTEHYWRAFQIQSSGGQLSRFDGKIPADLVDDLRTWIGERNEYVHRLLVQRVVIDGEREGGFPVGTFEEIGRFRDRCRRLENRIHDEATGRINFSDGPPELEEWSEKFAQMVMNRRKWE